LLTDGELAADRHAVAYLECGPRPGGQRRGARPAGRTTKGTHSIARRPDGGVQAVNAPLRRAGVVILVLFGLLFANLNWVQAYKGDAYRTSQYNGRAGGAP